MLQLTSPRAAVLSAALIAYAMTGLVAGQATSPTLYYSGQFGADMEVLSVQADGLELLSSVDLPARGMEISPNGKNLAIVFGSLQIHRIQPDGGLEFVVETELTDEHLRGLHWISDSTVAVLTDGNPQMLRTYRFDADRQTLEPADEQQTGYPSSLVGSIAGRPQSDILFVASAEPWIESYLVDEKGTLTAAATVDLPSNFARGLAVNGEGSVLYAATNTGGTKDVFAFHVNGSGALTPVEGQPFQALNVMPAQLAIARSEAGNEILLVNNLAGQLSTMFVHEDGTLTPTGEMFEPNTTYIPWSDAVIADGNQAFHWVWTHGPDAPGATGVFSWTVEDDGSLSPLAPVYETLPFTQHTLLAFHFPSPKVGDLTGSGSVGVADLLLLLDAWGACGDCNACPADLTGDCTINVMDLLLLLDHWG